MTIDDEGYILKIIIKNCTYWVSEYYLTEKCFTEFSNI